MFEKALGKAFGQPQPRLRVLMVCMGNICRSPTAEGVLRAKLEAAGLSRLVAVDSAGTLGNHAGEAPDARAQKHALARGYDLRKLRARKVTRDDLQAYDWVLAMDRDNLQRLEELAAGGGGRAQIGLLLDHAGSTAGTDEVPDPYYGPPAGFEHVLNLVELACDGLVARLRQTLGTS